MPYPKKNVRLPVIWSRDEVARLIDAAPTPFYRTILMTLYATGMRRAEVAALKLSDVDSARMVLQVADLIRAAGTTFYERSRKWFTWLHLKILTAIVCCRTSTLGGHIDECSRCGHRAISFNSCRNRHCPKCQANARDRWLDARRRELLPTRYV